MRTALGVMRGAASSATMGLVRGLLACLVLVGCAYGPDDGEGFSGSTVLIDPAFSDEEREVIVESLTQWASVTRAPLPSGWRIVREQSADPGEVGHADAGGKIIQIRPGLEPRMFRSTVLHELGHAHGIWHHVDRGVMQAWMADPPDVAFTPDDLAECRRVGVCR